MAGDYGRGRGMIASRQIAFGRGAGSRGPTAKDYVQDGMVAMWDGIENAGWGIHDNNADAWIDLVNGVIIDLTSSGSWSEDYALRCDGKNYGAYATLDSFSSANILSTECVCYRDVSRGCIFDIGGRRNNQVTMVGINANQYPFAVFYRYGQAQGGHFVNNLCSYGTFSSVRSSSSVTIPEDYYFNSEVAANTTGSTYVYPSSTTPLGIAIGATVENTNKWLGRVWSIRLYSRALTAEEIAHNYEIDKARFGL
jgi:hypothetical protein